MADITGTENNEVLTGTDEDDVINGLSGYDTLDGGEGSDTYIVNAGDFVDRYVDFYQDSGTEGVDVIQAAEGGITIGLGNGFSLANSGIEEIDGVAGSIISGDNDAQVWDFADVKISGVETIMGLGGMDVIRGSNGADVIDGGAGFDVLNGGKGRDTLMGGADSDELYGEQGRDRLYGDSGHDMLFGGDARDMLFGGEGHDKLYGEAGNDVLTGGAGYDTLDGGEGSDTYYVGLENAGFVDSYMDTGSEGRDRIKATDANTVIGLMSGFGPDSGIEVISGAKLDNVTIGGTNDAEIWDFSATNIWGVDWINALDGHDSIIGNGRRNKIDAGDGHDTVDGGAGNDVILGGAGHDTLLGGEGRDRLTGGEGNDVMDGGEGNDVYIFGAGDSFGVDTIMDTGSADDKDRIIAVEDNTVITLASGFDMSNGIEVISAKKHANVTIGGTDGADNWNFTDIKMSGVASIDAGDGMDVVTGSNRRDTINGEGGSDVLHGGDGRDILNGGADSDFLYGDNGKDQLFGDNGNDVLDGGRGRDIMTGGEGYDTFVFHADSGRDTITDFSTADDRLDMSNWGLGFGYDDLTITDTADGARVDYGDGWVLLAGVEAASVTEDLFVFDLDIAV